LVATGREPIVDDCVAVTVVVVVAVVESPAVVGMLVLAWPDSAAGAEETGWAGLVGGWWPVGSPSAVGLDVMVAEAGPEAITELKYGAAVELAMGRECISMADGVWATTAV
jgi:hypothetical protein